MIDFLQGRLVEKNPTHIILDCNGVGYRVNISLVTYAQILSEENIKINTHLSIKEDAHTLYGFFEKLEREVFLVLISVSGIGTNTAMLILSSLGVKEIVNAITNEDVNTIKSVKGIGLKTAQRVILELKDKMMKKFEGLELGVSNTEFSDKEEVLSALEVLGFKVKQSEKVIDKLIQEFPNYTIEEYIKNALSRL